MNIVYETLMYGQLMPRTIWTGSRITDTEPLTLDEASKFASKHAGTEITIKDFLRAAGRGEISLRAITHKQARLHKFDGGIYCNEGTDAENIIPRGSIQRLPISACRQLANTDRASWRTIDGFIASDGEIMRYDIACLMDDESDFETSLEDCRVTGRDVHALADAYIEDGLNQNNDDKSINNANNSTMVHKLKNRTSPLDAEITKAKSLAIDKTSPQSVFEELKKMAINKEGALVGYSSDGVQYMGKTFESNETPDVFTLKNLRDRMNSKSAKRRAKTE